MIMAVAVYISCSSAKGPRRDKHTDTKSPTTTDGTLRADILQHLKTVAAKAVEDMEKAGEVSGWEVDIDPAQDVLGTSRVEFTIHAVPVGVMRRAVVNIGYVKSVE